MVTKTILPLLFFISISITGIAQNKEVKELPANRTTQPVKIDGLLNDSAWKDAAPMNDLIEFRPKIGAVENYENRTETYMMYSDEGIYFGGYCHERTKDSIAQELAGRDGFGTNDFVGLIFDTYHDNINGFEYFVTPLGEQMDAKVAPEGAGDNNGGEDFSWNAVWQNASVIHEDGWSFEMFIPFSAIRFGKGATQDWGLNITRRRTKTGQQYTWNPVNPTVNGFLTQEGIWKGVTNIKPPLRLQFSPYFSVYANHYPANTPGIKNTTAQINGGLDLKYGINQAITLDATLIPDFGQVQSDNQVLNLTPFEVKFNENRSFFTEGTELFNKGNLFYSRRIGGTPIHLYDAYNIDSTETVVDNPSAAKLFNASKISGRMQSGFGFGVLNAITKPQYATIENINSKETRTIQTDPLTNYNVLVLDQTFKNNSSISLVNTNVLRSGTDYDANVTAALFDFNDKKNTWNLGGKVSSSTLAGFPEKGENLSGYSHNLYFGKTSGRFNFRVFQELTDTKYNSNDLGYFTNNNFIDHGAYAGYAWTEPKGWYNRLRVNFNFYTSRLFTPIQGIDKKFQTTNININANGQSKKLFFIGVFAGYRPKENDFYEPRQEGYFFQRGESFAGGGWFESNDAKKYSYSIEAFQRHYINFYKQQILDISARQNYRFNNKLSVSYSLGYSPAFNNIGFTAIDGDNNVIFARRKVNTIENNLGIKYSFTNKMGITFNARHYMSTVENKEFFTLQKSGTLVKNDAYTINSNRNANFFNIDMVYTWQFAPGSFINIVWKEAVYNYTDQLESSYFKNFGNTLQADANNNISLKVIYFLDYLQLKKQKS